MTHEILEKETIRAGSANKDVVLIWFQNEGAPLDLLLLATYIADRGYKPHVLICPERSVVRRDIDRVELEKWIKSEVLPYNPIAVGLSLYTMDVVKGLVVSEIIRKHSQDKDPIPMIWGGWHPTLYPELSVAEEVVDYVAIGDGEESLYELLECIRKKEKPQHVLGIAYKVDGNVKVNTRRQPMMYSDFEGISFEFLQEGYNTKNTYGDEQIFTGKGCPYKCTFCINTSYSRKYTGVSAQSLVNQVIMHHDKNGADSFRFTDELFFANKQRLLEFIDLIEKLPFKIKWTAQCTIKLIAEKDIIDDELLLRLRNSGLYMVYMGIESGSVRMLEKIKKLFSRPELVKIASKRLSDLGVIGIYNHIVGFPGETLDDIRDTFRSIDRLYQLPKAGFGGPFLFRPYPGADIYDACIKNGFKEAETLEEWAEVYYEGVVKDNRCPWITEEAEYLRIIMAHYCKAKNSELYDVFGDSGVGMFPNLSKKNKHKAEREVAFINKPWWRIVLWWRLTLIKIDFYTRWMIRSFLDAIHMLEFIRSIRDKALIHKKAYTFKETYIS